MIFRQYGNLKNADSCKANSKQLFVCNANMASEDPLDYVAPSDPRGNSQQAEFARGCKKAVRRARSSSTMTSASGSQPSSADIDVSRFVFKTIFLGRIVFLSMSKQCGYVWVLGLIRLLVPALQIPVGTAGPQP